MTDEKIITAFKICSSKGKCADCPYEDYCETGGNLDVLVLDLINRYAGEIKRLKTYKNLYEDLKAEHLETIKAINKCKAEAIKEFVNLFYDECLEDALIDGDLTILVNRQDFENLVREMTEERK